MTPSARVQAAIELLDAILEAAKVKGAPADRLISEYFKARRYAGSKDRRAVRELVYRAIRLCGPRPASGRAAMLAVARHDKEVAPLFDGSTHGPPAIGDDEKPAKTGIAVNWLAAKLTASGVDPETARSLLDRAPLDIRVNALKAHRDTIELPEEGEPLSATSALRFPSGTNIDQWPAFREGLIEIQDHGSQWVCEAVGGQSGEVIVDLCAGAGGKTLALASRLKNSATLIAADTDKRRLGNLAPRAARAGAGVDHTVLLDPGRELEALSPWLGKADRVLVDAPCSGSGTWRRNPEGRWRLDKTELERLTKLQDHVMDTGAQLVKPGGFLVFVTCSVLDEEGAHRVDEFINRHPGWHAIPATIPVGVPRGKGTRLTPLRDGTDGFFVAILQSSC
ncbi:MAG: RsmB/NOP family class I SAM-dependent RNA methyltransferase [Erythrobacter sp.]